MAYIDQGMPADRKKAAAGVVIIHAAIGTILVTGLATNFVPAEPSPPLVGENVEVTVPLPPPPPPKAKPDERVINPPTTAPEIYVPDPPIVIDRSDPTVTTATEPSPFDRPIDVVIGPVGTGPIGLPTQVPPAGPAFDPVAAKPSNAPGGWITQSDYKTSWINREYTGVAKFRLSVDSSGRASDCQILSSTGHAVLDTATCQLAQRRARFTAARNGNGDKVAGTYTASIRWELPD